MGVTAHKLLLDSHSLLTLRVEQLMGVTAHKLLLDSESVKLTLCSSGGSTTSGSSTSPLMGCAGGQKEVVAGLLIVSPRVDCPQYGHW